MPCHDLRYRSLGKGFRALGSTSSKEGQQAYDERNETTKILFVSVYPLLNLLSPRSKSLSHSTLEIVDQEAKKSGTSAVTYEICGPAATLLVCSDRTFCR